MKLLTSSQNMLKEINSLNIYTSEELIEYLPYRYEIFNYSNEYSLKDKDKVVILGRIVSNPRLIHASNIDIITFHFVSKIGKFYTVKVFNQPYLKAILNLGDDFTICGVYKYKDEINATKIKKGEIPEEERYVPVYHLTNDIQSASYRKLVKRTLDEYGMYVKNMVPSYLIDKYQLLNHIDALKGAHFPKNGKELQTALRTLKFEECLSYCYKNKIIRDRNKQLVKVDTIEIDTNKINEMIKSLSFKLTSDQTQAVREIVLDMKKKTLMYRLLQGDVGTGKTLVAGIALYANYLRNKQGVLMAPTESLALQHYENITKLFENYDIKVGLITGSMSEKEKRAFREELIKGEINIVIGTHAVFSASMDYLSLGLAIIDEQHRFGVNQRNLLANKGENVDLLLMSATPIPRTLSLSIYGDLDVSSLETYPNKKRNVKTLVLDYSSEKIIGLMNYCISNNKKVFLVCPKIISKGENDFASVDAIYDKYSKIFGEKIALLHGKMKSEDKNNILDSFKNGDVSILVATSIVELGIDIKNATGIVVFNADSFGLASLHQLRGRVGRDGSDAFCLLVDDFSMGVSERLRFLETCSDGFKVAEEDMKLRGPGDFMGIEQSGFPSFSCLNIVSDFKMFEIARDEIKYMMEHLDDSENKKLFDYIESQIEVNSLEDYKLFD